MKSQAEEEKISTPTLNAYKLTHNGRSLGAAAFCDCCETLHHHGLEGEFAGDVHSPHCISGATSPYAATGYKLNFCGDVEDVRAALPGAPFRGQGWRRFSPTRVVSKPTLPGCCSDEKSLFQSAPSP